MTFLLALPLATQAQAGHWVGTWAASPYAAPNTPGAQHIAGPEGTTLREVVHVSLGGPNLRLTFSNEFGTEPLSLGPIRIARPASGASVVPGSEAAVLFSGRDTITIPAGALAVSDPLAYNLPALSNLAVSFFLPEQVLTTLSQHGFANSTNYLAVGNNVSSASLEHASEVYRWSFLKGVEVQSSSEAVVTFGDSITDGAHSTRDANVRWPDLLAVRLANDKKAAAAGVLNEGIGGNRILHFGTGPAALVRFDHDVLALSGVRYLVILEGINDIGHAFTTHNPTDPASADDLITGLTQLAERAHAHGIKVFGATLTPYTGASYASPAGEAARSAVNQFIRTSRQFDGVLDFDKATRDPANPAMLLPAYDSGDHLHPSDAGYKAMADSIDLKLFER